MQGNAEQGRAGHNRAGQIRAGQNKAEQSGSKTGLDGGKSRTDNRILATKGEKMFACNGIASCIRE